MAFWTSRMLAERLADFSSTSSCSSSSSMPVGGGGAMMQCARRLRESGVGLGAAATVRSW